MKRLLLCGLLVLASGHLEAQYRLRFVQGCSGCTIIQTTDVAQTIINGKPAGSSFLFKAGIHRLDSISPRAGDIYVGEAGAVLSGAYVLPSASFATSGSFWKITGQNQTMLTRDGTCQITLADGYMGTVSWATSYPGCTYREELFIDNVRLTHVQTLGEVAAGKWFFDYSTHEITIGNNPSGHVVETSTINTAFSPTANNVTIRNLTIEKYATLAQYGAINVENATGWTVTGVTSQFNRSGGIRIGPSLHLTNSFINDNGQEGVVGIGDDVIVDNVEIARNNANHFDPGWEAGGTKFVLTNRLLVQNCNIHHNEGPGLWLDIDNYQYTLTTNNVHDNQQMGIFLEIGWQGLVSNNTVTSNGLAYWVPNYVWGVGILNAATKDLEISGNTLSGNRGGIAGLQQSRGSGTYGSHLVQNFYVHNNAVTINVAQGTPTWNGLADDTGSSTIFVSDNNRFLDNAYTLKTNTNYFVWNNVGDQSFSTWQGYGLDTSTSSVAFDAAVYGGSVTATSQTTALAVGSSAANRELLACVLGDATTDVITGATYNSVAMTLVDKQNSAPGSVYWQYLFALTAPATGTHNLVVSASTTSQISTAAASYSGVKQTSQPEASAKSSGSGNPYTATVTTVTAGAWSAVCANASVGLVDGAGLTKRASDATPTYTFVLGDSAAPVSPAGSTSLSMNGGGGQKQHVIVSLAPVSAGSGGSATVF